MDSQGLGRHLDQAPRWLVALSTVAGIGVIAIVDFSSGFEQRVYPLYYAPISLAAWRLGRAGSLAAALGSAAAWVTSNALAGLQFSSPLVWVSNTMVHAASFAIVGHLIASLKGALARERHLSRTDGLTGLLNSRAFFEDAGRLLALCQRKGRPATLAYLDLDDFKAVNDARGHEAGDDLLRAIAARFRTSTRPSDVCARLGGDEFAILLPEATPAEATAALERVQEALNDACRAQLVAVTCSVGAVAYLTVPEELEEMVREADERMYAAKAQGKNRLQLDVIG